MMQMIAPLTDDEVRNLEKRGMRALPAGYDREGKLEYLVELHTSMYKALVALDMMAIVFELVPHAGAQTTPMSVEQRRMLYGESQPC